MNKQNLSKAIQLIPICRALIALARTDAPNYKPSPRFEKCSSCVHFVRATLCERFDFPADPDYVCDDWEAREPDIGEVRAALVEQFGARNSRIDLKTLQGIHDMTIELGAKCHRPGPYDGELKIFKE